MPAPFQFTLVKTPVVKALVTKGPTGATGPAGANGTVSPIANNRLVGNVSGATATPTGLDKTTVKTLLGFVEGSDMQAAVEANSYDVLTLNNTAGGTATLVYADGVLEIAGVALATTTDIVGRQPLDSDLTAIAALSTTAYGRNLLTLANQAALQAAVGATGGGTWGSITGTLSSQTDLQTALNGKLGASVTKAELNTAVSDGNVYFVGDGLNETLGATTRNTVAATSGNFNGQLTGSVNSAASTPAMVLTGTWFSGGTGTTTQPHMLIQPTGTTASTSWNTFGTGLGFNSSGSYFGSYIDIKRGGTSLIQLTYQGIICSSAISGTDISASGNLRTNTNLLLQAPTSPFLVYISSDNEIDTACIRRGTNGQKIRVYGTSGASDGAASPGANYVRAELAATSTTVTLAAQSGGTGAANIDINLTPKGTGGIVINGGTAITKVLSSTATLDFGSIAANSFLDLTMTVTGAVANDDLSVSVPNAAVLADLVFSWWISATNTITIRCANNSTTTARDPGSGTYRSTVTQF